MRIPFFKISIKKRPTRGARLDVLEMSNDQLIDEVAQLGEDFGVLSRQVEATRKKVYREDVKQEGVEIDQRAEQADLTARLSKLQAGDMPPADLVG